MLPFGHLGIGSKLVSPWTRELPRWGILLGTVLPDLVDKPLFYANSWLSPGTALSLVTSTRTFSHTAIFLVALTALAVARRSKLAAALALGVATHLLLDNVQDALIDRLMPDPTKPPLDGAFVALLWPFYRSEFPSVRFSSMGGHLDASLNPITIGFEVVGAGILAWDSWKNRHESEIIQSLIERRRARKEARRKQKRVAAPY